MPVSPAIIAPLNGGLGVPVTPSHSAGVRYCCMSAHICWNTSFHRLRKFDTMRCCFIWTRAGAALGVMRPNRWSAISSSSRMMLSATPSCPGNSMKRGSSPRSVGMRAAGPNTSCSSIMRLGTRRGGSVVSDVRSISASCCTLMLRCCGNTRSGTPRLAVRLRHHHSAALLAKGILPCLKSHRPCRAHSSWSEFGFRSKCGEKTVT